MWRDHARRWVAAAALGTLILASPAAAAEDVIVPLDPISGGPLDDILPVDSDLLDVPFTNTISLTGETPVEAAIALSQATFERAGSVLVTRDDLFADAMASSVAQGVLNAPLLLTGRDSLDERLVAELERLGPTVVYLLGGTEALRPQVDTDLRGLGYVTQRISGPTRVETAIAVAQRFLPQATEAVVVRGYPSPTLVDPTQAYADLLAVGGLAADERVPVFLTQSNRLTDTLGTYLAGAAVQEARVMGGSAAVADLVLQALEGLGISTERVAGPTRAATAIAVAEERGFSSAADGDRVILAEGQREHTWAPGFAAAAHAARHDAPIVLSLGPVLPPETLLFIEGLADLLDEGPTLICAPFVHELACAQAALAMGQVPLALEPLLTLLSDVLELGEALLGTVTNAAGLEVSVCGLPAQEVAIGEDGGFALAMPAVDGVCTVVFTVAGTNSLTYQGEAPVTLGAGGDLIDDILGLIPDLDLPDLDPPDLGLPDLGLG